MIKPMDNKEKIIVDYLVAQYSPKAIILTGSIAAGLNTEHSDWDITIFVDKPVKGKRLLIDGESVDLEVIELPIPDDYVLMSWVGPYRDMKVLHDTNGLAERIVSNTRKARQAGPGKLSEEEQSNRVNRLRKAILKTSDVLDKPEQAFYYISSMYWDMVIRYWFEDRQEWPLQVYEALPYIKENDPAYYSYLQTIAGNHSIKEKYEACGSIFKELFGELS